MGRDNTEEGDVLIKQLLVILLKNISAIIQINKNHKHDYKILILK